MIDQTTLARAEAVLNACRSAKLTVATAESCTGGLIAATLTAIAGSSDVVLGGFVTYANSAKTEMVGVPAGIIEAVGAVSEAVARRMAAGAQHRTHADVAIAVTGIAGPGGGSADKPVGLVWFGLAQADHPVRALRKVFPGDRMEVRRLTVVTALDLLMQAAESRMASASA
jgi:nicotinamide-nucleotide amidase